MNKFYILKVIYTILSLLFILGNADENDDTFDDDDNLQHNNAMINVRLYKNNSECLNQLNSLYYYHTNFNIDCDCFKINSCFDKLIDSNRLNDFSFKYNNYSYTLNELNFSNQCYFKNGLYIYNELNIFQYCGSRIVLFVFCMLVISTCIFVNIHYLITRPKKKKYRYNVIENDSPPDYNTLN